MEQKIIAYSKKDYHSGRKINFEITHICIVAVPLSM